MFCVVAAQSANFLVTVLVWSDIDRVLPGVQEAHQLRSETAEQLLRRRGCGSPGSLSVAVVLSVINLLEVCGALLIAGLAGELWIAPQA